MRKEGLVIIYHGGGGGRGDTEDFHCVTIRFA